MPHCIPMTEWIKKEKKKKKKKRQQQQASKGKKLLSRTSCARRLWVWEYEWWSICAMARDLHRSTKSKRKKERGESKNENDWSADHIERIEKGRRGKWWIILCGIVNRHACTIWIILDEDCRRAADAVSDEDYYGEKVEEKKRKVLKVLFVVWFLLGCFLQTAEQFINSKPVL